MFLSLVFFYICDMIMECRIKVQERSSLHLTFQMENNSLLYSKNDNSYMASIEIGSHVNDVYIPNDPSITSNAEKQHHWE